MDKNKMIVVDGVRYELLPADYVLASDHMKQLRKILSRARTAVPEKLTDDVVRRLIGHTNVVYYNFETNAWNTVIYNGFIIPDLTTVSEFEMFSKSEIENVPAFNAKYEMAASVTMTIDYEYDGTLDKPVSNPKYSRTGTKVVGNIIVKNKITGKYELYCKSWFSAGCYFDPEEANEQGIIKFADNIAYMPDFRVALIASHER